MALRDRLLPTAIFPLILGCLMATAMTVPARASGPDAVGLVDPATGLWRLRTATGDVATFYYGDPGDTPFVGDWDCDGVDTPGLYRRSDGYVYLRNTNTQGPADISFFFGDPGDLPLAGDFDGDGCGTVSLYRPSEGRIYVINELGNGDGGLGAAEFAYYFGNPGDEPFTGDFNGDGKDSVGLYRQSSGFTYLRLTNTQGPADLDFFFGDPGDRFVAGDWEFDGTSTPGVFRSSDATFYLKDTNSQGTADVSFPFGDGTWMPIAGRWGAIDAIPHLTLEVVATGLDQPVFVDAPVGDGRLFVAEKGGRVRIVDGGSVLDTPYLVLTDISTVGERGLLGLAFHPDFAVNGRFFVHYSDSVGATKVVEYHAGPSSNVANPSPIHTILTVPQPATNHNGGMIEFGPDGYLYVSLGDGGGSPGNRPQDTANVLGSILRLDVDGVSPGAAAPGNPYAGGPGDDRIWAIGLRNPWRTTIDAESGTMIIADVGQDRREEVNLVPLTSAPRNYGWPIMEGSLCYPSGTTCQTAGLTLPVIEYGRGEGRSITGGYVYRGGVMPDLVGRYFYGDFITGFIRSFSVAGGGAGDRLDHTWELGTVGGLVSFGTDGQGELYVVSISGTISRIEPAP